MSSLVQDVVSPQKSPPVETVSKQNSGETSPKLYFSYKTLFPVISILIVLGFHLFFPVMVKSINKPLPYFTVVLFALLALFTVFAVVSLFHQKLREWLSFKSWFISVLMLLIGVYNVVTLKFQLIPPIYFPSPEKILKVYVDEYQLLLDCLGNSLRLLATGYFTGLTIGLTTGILVGWSKSWSYWINPLIKFIGPIPSTAWVPIALVVFPTSFQSSVFLIALAVWFPTTVLTSSGISNVKNAYFEVSSTLGASTFQKIFKIAIPDALPSIFIGVFNGTCASFLTLMTAEMLGVKSGIGWYINWQRDILSYGNVYAGLLIIAIGFSLIITLMFKGRNKLLSWQKGVIKW